MRIPGLNMTSAPAKLKRPSTKIIRPATENCGVSKLSSIWTSNWEPSCGGLPRPGGS